MGRSYKDLVAWQKAMDLVTAPSRANEGTAKGLCRGRSNSERLASLHLQAGVTGNWRLATGNFVLCR